MYFNGLCTEGIRDNVCVLYVDGGERLLDNMQDTMTGIKTPWTLKEAWFSPEKISGEKHS